MRYSVSRVGCFNTCPFQFKLRYLDDIETLPNYDDPQNALYLGSALHKGIETTTEEGIRLYFDSYPIINDMHINEAIKLNAMIPKVKALIPENAEFERCIDIGDDFIGYIDLLVRNADGTYDIYDFKYSNNESHYLESPQLHVYKYYFEKKTGKKVRKLYFIFVPKVQIRQKKTETVQTFRTRLLGELEKKEPKVVEVLFDQSKVVDFHMDIEAIENCSDFIKNETRLCDWCEFQQYCKEGIDYMLLPSTKRREIESVGRNRIWIYGSPFSGKTTIADKFPNPLMLNTDGNIRNVTAPYIAMKDVVNVEGRITTTTLAWEIFKETIAELQKKQNNFDTIVIDLVEDLYESCRLYMYKQMGITHESDDSFRAWDKVRTEFLSTMREVMNLDYKNIILISHEDTTKDITKRTGDKISSVRPNIQEKIANKLAGMVDIVIRAVVIDGQYKLTFKTDEVVFGGGRLNLHHISEINNSYPELIQILGSDSSQEETEEAPAVEEEKPKKRERKPRNQVEEAPQKEEETGAVETVELDNETEEAPAPRRRRRRSEA